MSPLLHRLLSVAHNLPPDLLHAVEQYDATGDAEWLAEALAEVPEHESYSDVERLLRGAKEGK